jgi:hypothetical protein
VGTWREASLVDPELFRKQIDHKLEGAIIKGLKIV